MRKDVSGVEAHAQLSVSLSLCLVGRDDKSQAHRELGASEPEGVVRTRMKLEAWNEDPGSLMHPSGNLRLKCVLPHGPNDVTGAVAVPAGRVQVAQEHNRCSILRESTLIKQSRAGQASKGA